jgi:hypothetical protein
VKPSCSQPFLTLFTHRLSSPQAFHCVTWKKEGAADQVSSMGDRRAGRLEWLLSP